MGDGDFWWSRVGVGTGWEDKHEQRKGGERARTKGRLDGERERSTEKGAEGSWTGREAPDPSKVSFFGRGIAKTNRSCADARRWIRAHNQDNLEEGNGTIFKDNKILNKFRQMYEQPANRRMKGFNTGRPWTTVKVFPPTTVQDRKLRRGCVFSGVGDATSSWTTVESGHSLHERGCRVRAQVLPPTTASAVPKVNDQRSMVSERYGERPMVNVHSAYSHFESCKYSPKPQVHFDISVKLSHQLLCVIARPRSMLTTTRCLCAMLLFVSFEPQRQDHLGFCRSLKERSGNAPRLTHLGRDGERYVGASAEALL